MYASMWSWPAMSTTREARFEDAANSWSALATSNNGSPLEWRNRKACPGSDRTTSIGLSVGSTPKAREASIAGRASIPGRWVKRVGPPCMPVERSAKAPSATRAPTAVSSGAASITVAAPMLLPSTVIWSVA